MGLISVMEVVGDIANWDRQLYMLYVYCFNMVLVACHLDSMANREFENMEATIPQKTCTSAALVAQTKELCLYHPKDIMEWNRSSFHADKQFGGIVSNFNETYTTDISQPKIALSTTHAHENILLKQIHPYVFVRQLILH